MLRWEGTFGKVRYAKEGDHIVKQLGYTDCWGTVAESAACHHSHLPRGCCCTKLEECLVPRPYPWRTILPTTVYIWSNADRSRIKVYTNDPSRKGGVWSILSHSCGDWREFVWWVGGIPNTILAAERWWYKTTRGYTNYKQDMTRMIVSCLQCMKMFVMIDSDRAHLQLKAAPVPIHSW